ncbi:hypothetical protein GGF43_005407, partial [Coemansia sp. RSA 2618]
MVEMLSHASLAVLGCRASAVRSLLSPAGVVFLQQIERAFALSSAVVNVYASVQSGSRLDVVVYPRPMDLFAAAKRLKKEYCMAQISEYPWCAEYVRERL